MKGVLHVYGNHDGGHGSGKVTNQFCPLRLPGMVRELGRHLIEVLANAEL
jgi:hypothetical protein